MGRPRDGHASFRQTLCGMMSSHDADYARWLSSGGTRQQLGGCSYPRHHGATTGPSWNGDYASAEWLVPVLLLNQRRSISLQLNGQFAWVMGPDRRSSSPVTFCSATNYSARYCRRSSTTSAANLSAHLTVDVDAPVARPRVAQEPAWWICFGLLCHAAQHAVGRTRMTRDLADRRPASAAALPADRMRQGAHACRATIAGVLVRCQTANRPVNAALDQTECAAVIAARLPDDAPAATT